MRHIGPAVLCSGVYLYFRDQTPPLSARDITIVERYIEVDTEITQLVVIKPERLVLISFDSKSCANDFLHDWNVVDERHDNANPGFVVNLFVRRAV